MDKWDERFLNLAKEIPTWSKDPSTQVGAVAIGTKGEVLAQGYNGFPRGVQDLPERYENKEIKYEYVVHAEMNCIYNASWNGVSLNDAYMFVYGMPVCHECAKGIIQVGIKKVIVPYKLDVPNKWALSTELTKSFFDEAGISYEYTEYED